MKTRIPAMVAALMLAAPAAANAQFPHTVAPGESLTSVAAADGLTIDQLAAENGISSSSGLTAGTTLLIPPQDGTSGATSAGTTTPTATSAGTTAPTAMTGYTSTVATGGGGYLVQPGDTLSAIADRNGLSVDQLASANGVDPAGLLLAGSSLSVPGASSTAGSSSYVATSSAPSTSGGPYPTPERVSASQVGSIGSANGVPASLADAIGWQESGFNNDEVSSAGAVGVMQIMPGTWDWIQRTMTAGTSLNPASASDNVRAGSLYLQNLLGSTGGDQSMAAAAYYQGLGSLQASGMYPSTQQYVNSVMALKGQFGGR